MKPALVYGNVYQALAEAEFSDPPRSLFLRRNSWGGERTVVEVIATNPYIKDWIDRPPPYYGDPKVYGWFHHAGTYKLIEVSCPGTFAYAVVPEPVWWRPPSEGRVYSLDGKEWFTIGVEH